MIPTSSPSVPPTSQMVSSSPIPTPCPQISQPIQYTNFTVPEMVPGSFQTWIPPQISVPNPSYPSLSQALNKNDPSLINNVNSMAFQLPPIHHRINPELDPQMRHYMTAFQPNNIRFPSVPLSSNNNYRMMHSFPYASQYGNGCNSFLPSMNRMKIRPEANLGHPPAQLVSFRDPNRDQNQHPPIDRSPANYRFRPMLNSIDIKKMMPTKRPLLFSTTDIPSTEISVPLNTPPPSEPIPKKKKSSHPNRELILHAINKGFSREVSSIDSSNGESKKTVIYKFQEGQVFTKKLEIRHFIMQHPELELTAEHFSFDTRLSLSPRKIREGAGKKKSVQLSTPLTEEVKPALINEPKRKKSINLIVPDKEQKVANSPIKKTLSYKHRKSISKHFKKLTDDSKYFDGLLPGAYRKKLPILSKILCNILVGNRAISPSEFLSIINDAICFQQFLYNFSIAFSINLKYMSLLEIVKSLDISNPPESTFYSIFETVFKILIKLENYHFELNHHYLIDNVYSLKWDWVIADELFRHYLRIKAPFLIDHQTIVDSICHLNLNELNNLIVEKKESVYNLRPSLKMFTLRFIIDQIVATSQFSAIINDIVENIGKYRREKFHLDNKIRQLKQKTKDSIVKVNLETNEECLAVVEDTSLTTSPDTKKSEKDPLFMQIEELEVKLEEIRDNIQKHTDNLRDVLIGSDRYGREYHYYPSEKVILVEGIVGQAGTPQYKNCIFGTNSKKPAFEQEPSNAFLSILNNCLFGESNEVTFENINIYFEDILKKIHSTNQNALHETLSDTQVLLLENPKLIRNVSEDEFEVFVEYFAKNHLKYKKKTPSTNEFAEGWWYISHREILSEVNKSMNHRGIREHSFSKNYTRNIESNNNLSSNKDEENISDVYTSSECYLKVLSIEFIQKQQTDSFIILLRELCEKMDNYLAKIEVVPNTSITSNLENLLQKEPFEIKKLISNLVLIFVQCCERKFDRQWLSRWNDCVEVSDLLSSIYMFCHSLKLKIDPNSKICRICNKVDDSLTISECNTCLLSAHNTCIEEPMRKIKKTKMKMICYKCYKETLARNNRSCKACGMKTGKFINCDVCNESYHNKCIGSKAKSKLEPITCDDCTKTSKISNPKVYERPQIEFENVSFKKCSTSCENLLKNLQQNKDAHPFLEPVDSNVPAYYDIIKKPMDLSLIEKKFKANKYKTASQFFNDIIQIFENCHVFNEDNSKIARCGARLQKYFEKEWQLISSSFSLKEE